ncbi:hypothetical protein [Streptomyces sp. NPDC051546]|uniref:hypothetical protein n=1 Tax=Streptomyces sp. NPDC051546 TaxID=3365655 RepID=UPI0037A50659
MTGIATKGDLLASIRYQRSSITQVYKSNSALINRVDVAGVDEAYFILVEGDCFTDEDEAAFAGITACPSWRRHILEVTHFPTSHPHLLWTAHFSMHVLHPAYYEASTD